MAVEGGGKPGQEERVLGVWRPECVGGCMEKLGWGDRMVKSKEGG